MDRISEYILLESQKLNLGSCHTIFKHTRPTVFVWFETLEFVLTPGLAVCKVQQSYYSVTSRLQARRSLPSN